MVSRMKSPQFKLVVVDLMSVVADSGDVTARLLATALSAHRVEASHDEVRSVIGLPLRRAVAALFRTGTSLDADARRVDRIHDEVAAALGAHYAQPSSIREIHGATRTLGALRAQGMRIAVATVMPSPVRDALASGLSWFDRGLVDTLVGSEQVDAPRPQPGMIVEAMMRTGVVDAKRVIKLGDTPADLAEGTLAGCGMVVGMTRGLHPHGDLVLRPHTHLIEQMPSLLDLVATSSVATARMAV
jgi:phosphonatase-like hydrolase